MPSGPGTLPNGQIVDNSTGLVETLEAVKEEYEAASGSRKSSWHWLCDEKCRCWCWNPDTGRVKLIYEEDKSFIFIPELPVLVRDLEQCLRR